MKTLLLFIPLLLAFGPFDSPKGIVEEGNTLFEEGRYDEALQSYDRALPLARGKGAVEYNRANTLLKKGDIDGALKGYEESIADGGRDLRGMSLYNMGNALYAAEKFGQAAEAYKEALKNDPADEDAKVNLELALRKLEEKQNEQQDGGDKKDGEKGESEEEKPEDGDSRPDKNDKDKDDHDKDKQKEKEAGRQDAGDDERKDQSGKEAEKKESEMSKTDAERLLDSLGDRNIDLQTMKDMLKGGRPAKTEKDW